KEIEGPDGVGRQILDWIVDGSGDLQLSCLMRHEVDAAHRAVERFAVEDVASHHLDIAAHRRQILLLAGAVVVEHAQVARTVGEQRLDEVRANETEPPRHQHSLARDLHEDQRTSVTSIASAPSCRAAASSQGRSPTYTRASPPRTF